MVWLLRPLSAYLALYASHDDNVDDDIGIDDELEWFGWNWCWFVSLDVEVVETVDEFAYGF